jgi:hypothetical protein
MIDFAVAVLAVVLSAYLSVCMMIYATGNPMIGFAVMLLLTVVFTFLCGWIAGRRGRSTRLWYWLGPFSALSRCLPSLCFFLLRLHATVKLNNSMRLCLRPARHDATARPKMHAVVGSLVSPFSKLIFRTVKVAQCRALATHDRSPNGSITFVVAR